MAKFEDGKLFNVLVGGVSIGITPTVVEAQNWLRGSMSQMKKEIVPFSDNCGHIRARLCGSPIVGAKIKNKDS